MVVRVWLLEWLHTKQHRNATERYAARVGTPHLWIQLRGPRIAHANCSMAWELRQRLRDLAAVQGLCPAVPACMCVAEEPGNAKSRRARRRPRSGAGAQDPRLRPVGVWFAVFAGEHSMARCVASMLLGLLPAVRGS